MAQREKCKRDKTNKDGCCALKLAFVNGDDASCREPCPILEEAAAALPPTDKDEDCIERLNEQLVRHKNDMHRLEEAWEWIWGAAGQVGIIHEAVRYDYPGDELPKLTDAIVTLNKKVKQCREHLGDGRSYGVVDPTAAQSDAEALAFGAAMAGKAPLTPAEVDEVRAVAQEMCENLDVEPAAALPPDIQVELDKCQPTEELIPILEEAAAALPLDGEKGCTNCRHLGWDCCDPDGVCMSKAKKECVKGNRTAWEPKEPPSPIDAARQEAQTVAEGVGEYCPKPGTMVIATAELGQLHIDNNTLNAELANAHLAHNLTIEESRGFRDEGIALKARLKDKAELAAGVMKAHDVLKARVAELELTQPKGPEPVGYKDIVDMLNDAVSELKARVRDTETHRTYWHSRWNDSASRADKADAQLAQREQEVAELKARVAELEGALRMLAAHIDGKICGCNQCIIGTPCEQKDLRCVDRIISYAITDSRNKNAAKGK